MTPNKFATMLHKNTNKLTLILVYALLEWVLILLLLLNSLFSYLIIKFAHYFGLKPPCLLCSRLDHLFDPVKFRDSYRSIVCESHAVEISKLGYCLNHKRLALSHDMCEDCFLSSASSTESQVKKFSFFPWMNQLGIVQGCCEEVSCDEVAFNCSCCGGCLDKKLGFRDYCLIKPSLDSLDCEMTGDLILESGVDNHELVFEVDHSEKERVSENLGIDVAKREEDSFVSMFDSDAIVGDEGDKVDRSVEDNFEEMGADHGCKVDTVIANEQGISGCEEMGADHDDGKVDMVIEKKWEVIANDRVILVCEEMGAVHGDKVDMGIANDQGVSSCEEIGADECVKVDLVVAKEREVLGYKEMVVDENGDVHMAVGKEVSGVKEDNFDVSLGDHQSCEESMMVQVNCGKGMQKEMEPQHLEFFIDQEDCHLIPIESIGSSATESEVPRSSEGNEVGFCSEDFVLELDKHDGTQYELVLDDLINLDEEVPLLSLEESEVEHKTEALEVEAMELAAMNYYSLKMKQDLELDGADFVVGDVAALQATKAITSNVDVGHVHLVTSVEEMISDDNQDSEEELDHTQSAEIEPDVSIGTEVPDHERIDGLTCEDREPSCSYADDHACLGDGSGYMHAGDDVLEFRILTSERNAAVINDHLSLYPESNEVEEGKFPDTHTSENGFLHMHKKFLVLEREESVTEKSLDGSSVSNIGVGNWVVTVEELKSALKAQKKELTALYAELEEERSASAVAASETMAMINRLQEEKAAMQMEALQYQRMMEEQSDYDHESLQLMNDLMVKREKEKAELEKELELYRKRVHECELKEKIELLRGKKESSTRSGSSSPCSSNEEDSDEVSVDLCEMREEHSFNNHHGSTTQTPADAVLYLEESLSSFEEERLAILDQLKVLEEKLFMLNDAEEPCFEDINSIESLQEENGVANGHYKSMNGKHHHERKGIALTGKTLLPLFDATDAGENGMLNGHSEQTGSIASEKSASNFDTESKKLAIEDEVDHVYERLHVLEADGEFLKHCITSLRKGDKGIELLQEILQHLRDLRSVELRSRHMTDGVL